MKILVLISVLYFSLYTLSAQDGQPPSLIKGNGIKKIEAYFFQGNATQDSTLITVEDYNTAGWRTKIEIYDSLGLANHYEYDYLFDSIKTERRTFFRNEFDSVTKIENDQFGNELSAIDYNADGEESGWKSINKYNDQGQLIESSIYDNSKLVICEESKYHSNGEIMETAVTKLGRLVARYVYDENGKVKQRQDSKNYYSKVVFENYKSTGRRMDQIDSRSAYKKITIGVGGVLDLARFDNLRTQIFYLDNGLIDYEVQYVNGKLIGKQKNKYIK